MRGLFPLDNDTASKPQPPSLSTAAVVPLCVDDLLDSSSGRSVSPPIMLISEDEGKITNKISKRQRNKEAWDRRDPVLTVGWPFSWARQRAFRERREKHVQALVDKINKLELAYNTVKEERDQLQQRLEALLGSISLEQSVLNPAEGSSALTDLQYGNYFLNSSWPPTLLPSLSADDGYISWSWSEAAKQSG